MTIQLPPFPNLASATAEQIYELRSAYQQYEAQETPKRLIELLEASRHFAYPGSTIYEHSIQAATRALRDNADNELIAVALLHDVGEIFNLRTHSAVIAEMLKPFISPKNYWILYHHPVFQAYYFNERIGLDPNIREQFKDNPYYEDTIHFCECYDQAAFDKNYKSLPLEEFKPLVYELFAQSKELDTTKSYLNVKYPGLEEK